MNITVILLAWRERNSINKSIWHEDKFSKHKYSTVVIMNWFIAKKYPFLKLQYILSPFTQLCPALYHRKKTCINSWIPPIPTHQPRYDRSWNIILALCCFVFRFSCFVFLRPVFCGYYGLCFCTAHTWLPLRCSLAFISNKWIVILQCIITITIKYALRTTCTNYMYMYIVFQQLFLSIMSSQMFKPYTASRS